MANNAEYVLKFKVSEDGSLKILNKELDKTAKATDKASAAQSEHNYRLNQGVAGTSSAAKSFSKLTQTIGNGPNGLVGAYATLAANAFAVSAAFNALRGAAQVEQVLKGLEVQGARTGKTLTNTAREVEALARGSLSAADAMQTVAQASAAGFSPRSIKELTVAAQNASIALGRNMPEAMDRIVKGTTKLEPELLDELGIMVKLDEASTKYANKLGKTAASLTSVEKRQAFLNAVLEESNTKFGGLSESVDANPYDQLAASFANLTTKVLNLASSLGITSIVAAFANNTGLLVSAIILFGSTISRSLLPGLYSMAEAARDSSEALAEKAATQREAVATSEAQAVAEAKAAAAAARTLNVVDKNKQVYKDYAQNLKEGTATQAEQTKVLRSLTGQISYYSRVAKDAASSDAQKQAAAEFVAILEQQKAQVISVGIAEANSARISVEARKQIVQARMLELAMTKRAAAEGALADAIQLAGTGNLRNAYKQLTLAVIEYNTAQKIAARGNTSVWASTAALLGSVRTAAMGATTATIAYARANGAMTPVVGTIALVRGAWTGLMSSIAAAGGVMGAARVSMFALAGGAKVLGAALLNAIPIIGQIIFVLQMVIEFGGMAWDWMFPPPAGQDALDKATESLDEIIKRLDETAKRSSAIFADKGASAAQTSQAYSAMSNSVREVADAFAEVQRAQAQLGTEAAKTENLLSSKIEAEGTTLSKSVKESQEYKALNGLAKLGYQPLTQDIMKATVESEAFNKANAEGQRKIMADAVAKLGEKYGTVGAAIEDFRNALKGVDEAVGDFTKSMTIATPYDTLVDKVTEATATMYLMRAEVAKGALAQKDYYTQLAQTSSRTGGLFTEGTQEALKSLRDSEAELSKLRDQQANKTSTLVDYTNQIAAAEERRNRAAESAGQLVEKDLIATQAKLVTMQKQFILTEGAAKIEQARYAKYSEFLNDSVAGFRAQQAHEERMRSFESSKISAQKTMLELLNAQNSQALSLAKANVEALKAEIANLQAKKQSYGIIESFISRFSVFVNKLMGEEIFEVASPEKIAETQKALDEANAAVVRLTQESNKLDNAILSANQSLAALNAAQLTGAEKAAEVLGIQRDTYAKLDQKRVAMETKLLELQERRLSLETNISNKILSSISAQNIAYTKQREALARQYAEDEAKNKTDIENIKARSGIDEATRNKLIEGLTTTFNLRTQEYELDLKILEATRALNIAETAKIDIYKEGLEIQQQSLSVIQKNIDLNKTIIGQERDIALARLRVAAKRAGTEVNPEAEQAIAFAAAQREYQLALESHKLKLAGIDAEYDLLEAQRMATVSELRMRSMILEEFYKSQQGGITEQQRTALAQINAAADNYSVQTYDAARALAKAQENNNLTLLKLRAEELSIFTGADAANPVSKVYNATQQAIVAYENIIKGIGVTKAKPEDAMANAVSVIRPDLGALKDTLASNEATLKEELGKVSLTIPDLTTSLTTLNANFEALIKGLQSIGELAPSVTRQSTVTPSTGMVTQAPAGLRLKPGAWEGPVAAPLVDLAKALQDRLGSQLVRFTAFNDAYHKSLGQTTGHAAGTKFDFTVADKKNMSMILQAVREEAAKLGISVKVTDEYANPSSRSTGGHIDVAMLGALQTQVAQPIVQAITTASQKPASTAVEAANDNVAPESESIVVTGARKTPSSADYASKAVTDVQNLTQQLPDSIMDDSLAKLQAFSVAAKTALAPFIEQLKSLGPEGELAAAVAQGMQNIGNGVLAFTESIKQGGLSLQNVATLASTVLSTISSITSAASNARIAGIEKEIAAEEKRDGKSAQSVAKIEAMEKKKDQIARKQFNTNKKISMAQAVIATATGMAEALKLGPIAGPILAGMIGALGLAQIAIISGTQYESSYAPRAASMPTSLSIGKRADSVDLARGPNVSAGGEIGYLRGMEGTGANASNYRTVGSAYGGDLMRGYGNRGFVVGEKGPEVISPETPVNVTPANDINGNAPVNATINIQAIDSQGVQDVLVAQKGNIIQMLREAANSSGQRFLEDVNVNVYTRPNVGRL